tara:strand:+ start:2649 stop:3014 length:366 start_codon:yes stop_codon:yes gene_type:complete
MPKSSLSKQAEKKISNIKYSTNLFGYYQFNNKKEAALIINKYQDYMHENGTFIKNRTNANCDPIFQQLSAAIDYYKFEKKRHISPYLKKKTNIKEKSKSKSKPLTHAAITDLNSIMFDCDD